MTLEEATAHIGDKVIYRASHSPAGDGRPVLRADDPGSAVEEGVITSVGRQFVFVRYASDHGSKATYPAMLELLGRA